MRKETETIYSARRRALLEEGSQDVSDCRVKNSRRPKCDSLSRDDTLAMFEKPKASGLLGNSEERSGNASAEDQSCGEE